MPCEVVPLRVEFFKMAAIFLAFWPFPWQPWKRSKC